MFVGTIQCALYQLHDICHQVEGDEKWETVHIVAVHAFNPFRTRENNLKYY